MDYERQFKFKFLVLFSFVGLINIIFISQIYYFESKEALIDRASSQLVAVRELYQSRFFKIDQFHDLKKDLNKILKMGMGTSGEIYLVDSDFHISTSSRFGSQWSKSIVKNEASLQALKNISGVSIVRDYRGVKVISAYGPIQIEGKTFALLCEMDMEEVLYPLQQTKKKIFIISALLTLLTLFLSLLFSKKLINFLRLMKNKIDRLHKEKSLEIIEAQELERIKVARDVHDGIGQLVTSLKWQLSLRNNEQDNGMIGLCERILSEVRSISQNVIPSVLKDFGIVAALDELLNSLKQLERPRIKFHITDAVKDIDFKESYEINLYRIVQELIQNALKHSQAQEVKISLEIDKSNLKVIYQDNGIGMRDKSQFPPKSLDYRVKLFHGELIRPESEMGFQLILMFNLAEIINESIHH